ncbi:MAG: hypothetical protein NW224_27900 [Leptolyngbyaceae cyanobacterium bins.302]|nr:hypothetical protein [Leptolyngbyaceae cyanobacterium bins.302]
MQPENVTTKASGVSNASGTDAAGLNASPTYQTESASRKTKSATRRSIKLAREISKLLPCVLPAVTVLSAVTASAIPVESSLYGTGMVLQAPDDSALPNGVTFTGKEGTIDRDRFLEIESLDRNQVTITNWQTRELSVTLPNGQAATAVFYGSTNYRFDQPGDAVKRGFTLPEERMTFSTNPEFLRTSGLNGILPNNAFTGEAHGSELNPTEFGNAFIKGGMTTSANWMIVRDRSGQVLFEGTPATYGAQLYWNGTTAELSDAEGLQIGEGNYQTTTETTTEITTASTLEQRSRQELVETQHSLQGKKTWSTVESRQRTETSTDSKPFQTEEVTQSQQNFVSDLSALFPLQTVAILHRDKANSGNLILKTGFQFAGDVKNDSNPTLSGQLRIPLNTKRGTSSLNVLVGGAPQNDKPGQPNFYALLFAQLNTPLFKTVKGQHQPNQFVAGMRFGGGVYHVPVAAQVVTQTVTKSGVDIISEQRTFNDFTTTNWGQDFTTTFTRQTTNDYVDTFRLDTIAQTPVSTDITDVVVTRTDGSTFIASDYRRTAERRGETTSSSTRSFIASDLVAANSIIQPGTTQYSSIQLLAQSTVSQLVGTDISTDRVVQDVTVTQTVSEKDAWGTLIFVNPYLGNFDLASVLQPGSLLYEVGGNFVRSSLLDHVSYKDSNLYMSLGMPVVNSAYEDTQSKGSNLLTIRAYATYLPVTNDVRVGAGLQLSGF